MFDDAEDEDVAELVMVGDLVRVDAVEMGVCSCAEFTEPGECRSLLVGESASLFASPGDSFSFTSDFKWSN